jgi:hypothetical protein
MGTETKNKCAGEGQQQFTRPTSEQFPSLVRVTKHRQSLFGSCCADADEQIQSPHAYYLVMTEMLNFWANVYYKN